MTKRAILKRILGIILSVSMVAALLNGCGLPFGNKDESEPGVIHEATVEIKNPEGVRAVVESEAAVMIPAYLTARAYFDKLEYVDFVDFDAEEYIDTIQKAYRMADITEKLADRLDRDCDELIAIQDAGDYMVEPATMKEVASLERIPGSEPFANPLITPVYAKDKSASVKWAESITKTFDKARTGEKLKAVAKEMGTDVQHAKKAMELAQDIITGDAYHELSDVENLCYQRCHEIKATSTAAGFVVGVMITAGAATAAAGAAAAGTAGSAAAGAAAGTAAGATGTTLVSALNTANLTCQGVNAFLDIGTAGTIVYTNGEGNSATEFFENTSAQFAPISSTVGLANAAVNITNIGKAVKARTSVPGIGTAADNAKYYKAITEEGGQLLTFIASEKVNYDNSDGKTIMNGVFSKTKDGWKITVQDTLLGVKPEEKKAASQVLQNAGVEKGLADGAVQIIADEIQSGDWPHEPEVSFDGPLPSDALIEQWDGFNDEDCPFDVDAYLDLVDDMMEDAIQEYEGNGYSSDDSYDDYDDEDMDIAEDSDSSDGEADDEYDVSGTYSISITPSIGPADTSDATVTLNDDNFMTVDFATHRMNDDLVTLNMNEVGQNVHLVGIYDPETMTFRGNGTGETHDASDFYGEYDKETGEYTFHNTEVLGDSFWDVYETVLHFDTNGSVTGTNAAGQKSLYMDCESKITMTKKKTGPLTVDQIAGTYPCHGYSALFQSDNSVTYIFEATGANKMTICDDEQPDDKYEGVYDPNTCMWSYTYEGDSITARFMDSGNGNIGVTVVITIDGQEASNASGYKE